MCARLCNAARVLHNLDCYYIIRVHHIKTRSLAKSVSNVLLLLTLPTASHVYTCTFTQLIRDLSYWFWLDVGSWRQCAGQSSQQCYLGLTCLSVSRKNALHVRGQSLRSWAKCVHLMCTEVCIKQYNAQSHDCFPGMDWLQVTWSAIIHGLPVIISYCLLVLVM